MVTKPSNNLRREHAWLKESNIFDNDNDILLSTLSKQFSNKKSTNEYNKGSLILHNVGSIDRNETIEVLDDDDDDDIILTNISKPNELSKAQTATSSPKNNMNPNAMNEIQRDVSTSSRVVSTYSGSNSYPFISKDISPKNVCNSSDNLQQSTLPVVYRDKRSNKTIDGSIPVLKAQKELIEKLKDLNKTMTSKIDIMESTSLSEDYKRTQINTVINPKIKSKQSEIEKMELKLETLSQEIKNISHILSDISNENVFKNIKSQKFDSQRASITANNSLTDLQINEGFNNNITKNNRDFNPIPDNSVIRGQQVNMSSFQEESLYIDSYNEPNTQSRAPYTRQMRDRHQINYRIPEADEPFEYRVGKLQPTIASDDTTYDAENTDNPDEDGYLTTQDGEKHSDVHQSDLDFIEDSPSEITHDTAYVETNNNETSSRIQIIMSSPNRLDEYGPSVQSQIDLSGDSLDSNHNVGYKMEYIGESDFNINTGATNTKHTEVIENLSTDSDNWGEVENLTDYDAESFDEERENKTRVSDIEELDNELEIITERKIGNGDGFMLTSVKKEESAIVSLSESHPTSLTDDELEEDISLLGVAENAESPPHTHITDVVSPNSWTKEVYKKLKTVFNLTSFRSNQEEAINATLSGKDVFVLMPTGGGKSLCYQLPAIVKGGCTKGTTIVISPLISLMQDQVEHLQKLNVKARMLSSKGGIDEKNHTFNLFINGFLDLIYLSPEMISVSEKCKTAIEKLYQNKQLARIVVDEAHCVSNWGHDFRPDYKQLSYFKVQYPDIPMMALTATASEQVQMDIVFNLKLKDNLFLRQSFNRTNLYYEVRKKTRNTIFEICDTIKQQFRNQTGIIYCHSKNSCEQTAQQMQRNGIKCAYYHAGMEADERLQVQREWQNDNLQVICATVAFGMGIDKADVRFVFHFTVPRTLEGYYQETGRAGRDGNYSYCITYYSFRDVRTMQTMIQKDKNLDGINKQKHLDKLQQVTAYCENDTDCRRKLVLSYFSEEFDPINCNKNCDNCRNSSSVTKEERDVTSTAISIVKLVQSIQNQKVTLIYCQNIFKGSRNSKIVQAGHDMLPQHGAGKNLTKSEIERIFFHLITKRILQEYSKVNNAGFSSSYVKVGDGCRDLLNGKLQLKIQFSVSEGNSRSSAGLPKSNSSNTNNYDRSLTKNITANNDSEQHLRNYAYSPSNSERMRAESSKHTGSTQEVNDLKSAYDRLRNAAISWGSRMVPAVNKFMDDNVLRRLAAILPATEEEFIGIVGNNSTDSKKYKYFKDIFIDLRKRRIERMCNLSSNFAFNEEGQSQIDTMEIQTTSRFFNNTDENKNLVSLTPYEQSTQVSKGVNARTAGGKKYKRNFNYKRYRNYNKWKK